MSSAHKLWARNQPFLEPAAEEGGSGLLKAAEGSEALQSADTDFSPANHWLDFRMHMT